MRRMLALVLVGALVATAGVVSPLHVHAYTDHDHPEHHHGPAAHLHGVDQSAPQHDVSRVEPCDPGQHQLGATFVCASATSCPQVDPAEWVEPGAEVLPEETKTAASIADVRVHGPPVFPQASPRAPPLIAPA